MSELTAAQQRTVEEAFERFLEVYRVESRVPPYADTVEREQAHFEAMREGVAAVLFPPSNGRRLDRDDGRPMSERERFETAGVPYDLDAEALARSREVPARMGHMTVPWPEDGGR